MDDEFLISMLLCLVVIWIVCEILGVIAYSRVGKLRREVNSLQAKFNELLRNQPPPDPRETPNTPESAQSEMPASTATQTVPVSSPDPIQAEPTNAPATSPPAL